MSTLGELPHNDFAGFAKAMRATADALREVASQAERVALTMEERASTQVIEAEIHVFRVLIRGMTDMLTLVFSTVTRRAPRSV